MGDIGRADEAIVSDSADPVGSDLLSRLPADIFESLSPEQRAALWAAAHQPSWRRYPVNIRMAVPWFGRRLFVTLVAGADRRNQERLLRERRLHPLRTFGNVLFLVFLIIFLHALAFGLIFLLSAVVEF